MFDMIKDKRGSLIPIEFSKLSFIPVRVFSVFDVPKGEIRGNHAHYNTIQQIICIKGEVIVGLDYGDKIEETKILPGQSILVDKLVWDWQKFLTGEDIILVLCSTPYDIQDYILDKDEFCRLKNNNI
jgi:quercetin dioxygenase-like cupin family protein